jgi:MFS family permease
LVVLIDVLGLTIILPLLPFYSEKFGAKPIVVGALVSVYALCQMVSGPILGNWSDRIGRKPVLIVSQIGTFLGFIMLAFAPSLVWIFVSRIIDGVTAGNLSTAQAYITDVAAPQDRAKELGKIGIAFAVGFFIGPTMTAFLYRFGYHAPIFAAASLSALSVVASAVLLPRESVDPKTHEAHPHQKKPSPLDALAYFKQPGLAQLFLQIFLFYFSFSIYVSGFALFSERRFQINGMPMDAKQVGYAFAYFGLLGIIIQGFLIGPLVKRFGQRKIVLAGFISSFLGYVSLAFAGSPFLLGLTGLFTSFGAGVLRPVLLSEITEEVSPRERGRVIGVNQSIQSLAQIIAPIVGTALIGAALLPHWSLVAGGLNLLGIILVLIQRRKTESAKAKV